MGYSLTGYKLKPDDTKQSVSEILNGETDEEDYQGLALTTEEKVIIDRCLIDEYSFEKDAFGEWVEYEKNSILISISADSIGIGVPYWEEAKADIQLVFEIVNKITTQTAILFWDPQGGDFVSNDAAHNQAVYEYGLNATNEIIEEIIEAKPKAETPWWQFWK